MTLLKRWIFRKTAQDEAIAGLLSFLDKLGDGPWEIKIAPYKRTRSLQQNRYLYGVVYPAIIEGAHLEGWEIEDVHEWCLGEHFGWETFEGLGRKRIRPIKRSSRLSTTEFSDYIAWIQRTFAQKYGVHLPAPEEEFERAA